MYVINLKPFGASHSDVLVIQDRIQQIFENYQSTRPDNARHPIGVFLASWAEVKLMSNNTRRQALHAAGLAHPRPDAVTAPLFHSGDPFFFALDKVQVKYEMLRAHFGDGDTVTAAAAAHGYSRAEFYLVAAAFERSGMTGLLDERRGRKGPVKLTEDVHTFLDGLAHCSAAEAAAAVADQLGVVVHPRTIQRARRR
jgi:transposase